MAKNIKIEKQEKAPAGIIINQVTVNRVNRQVLDIGKWRNAILSADMGRMTLLYDMYEDLLLDGRLSDAIDRRIRAVTGADITFQYQDGSEEQQMVDLIDSQEFEYLLHEVMQSLFWGVTLLQLDFTNGLEIFSVPRKHIRPKNKTVAVMQNDIDGQISYDGLQNIIEVVNKRDRFGLIHRAAPYVIMMRGGIGDWAQMVELFGMPQRVGKYSIYDQEARKQLEEAFREQGAAASMVVPKETDIETTTNSGSVNSSVYKDFIAELKEALLVTILSNTMTTLDGSSRSQSEVHQDVEDEVNKNDLRFVQRVLNKQLKPILEARGFKVAGGSFVFPKALKELTVDELVSLSDIIEIPAYYIQEKYGIPQAKGGDKLARKQAQTAMPPEGGANPPAVDPPAVEPKKLVPGKKDMKLSDSPPSGGWGAFWEGLSNFFVVARTMGGRAMSALNLADKSKNFTAGINIDALFEQALKDIYAQYGVDPESVPAVNKILFDISNGAYQSGIDGAFSAEFGKVDPEFINRFKTNAAVFAAFKSHAQQNEIVAQLISEDGNLKSFHEFKKSVLGTTIKADYNKNWLKTEYNMAVRSARMAEKWKGFERAKHLYPNLEFIESTAAHKRPEHLQWVGTILPIDHPWWNTHTPPVGWGCECSIRNTDKPVTTAPGYEEPVPPVFANNPGKTAEFINMSEHPMVKGVCKNFGECKTRLDVSDGLKPECQICVLAKQYYSNKVEEVKFKSGGKIQKPVNFKQNSQEEKKNIKAYTALAKDYGEQYRLLTVVNKDNQKNPDALNLKTLAYSDAKIPETKIGKNAIQNSIKSASEQKIVSEVYIYLEHQYPILEVWKGLKAALQGNRANTVKKIIIRFKNGDVKTYDAVKLKKVFNKKSKGNIKD